MQNQVNGAIAMKEVIMDIREMSDSKEMYASRPNRLIPIFIYTLVTILLITIIYFCFAEVDIYVSAKGIIRPNDDVSTVTTSFVGKKVTEVYLYDGQTVNEGDVLFKVDTSDLEISLESLDNKEKEYKIQMELYNKFLTGIQEDVNPFSNDTESEEYPFYIKYLNYAMSVKNAENQYYYDKTTNEVNIQNLNKRISEITEEIAGWNAYKVSVEQGQNLAVDYPEYDNMYKSYVATMNSYDAEYSSGRNDISLDTSNESNQYYLDFYRNQIREYVYLCESIKKLNNCFPTGDESTYKYLYDQYVLTVEDYNKQYAANPDTANAMIKSYTNSLLLNYSQKIEELKVKVEEIELEMKGSQEKDSKLYSYDNSYANTKSSKYYQTITEIESNINTLSNELEAIKTNLTLYQALKEKYNNNLTEEGVPISIALAIVEETSLVLDNIEICEKNLKEVQTQIRQTNEQIYDATIKAEKSGTVNVISTIVVGDTISSSAIIATIIPKDESEYKVQLYVSNSDIANIKEGDSIKYDLAALPYTQYGLVEGKVTSISKDVYMQNGEYSGFFLVEGNISNEKLTDKDGNTGNIGIGMQVYGKIVSQRKRIIRYLFEKINLF